jgi:Mor family transcriptional regulator
MGIKFEAKTERNFEVYNLWKKKGYLTKEDREAIYKNYDISKTALYRIIRWCKKKESIC